MLAAFGCALVWAQRKGNHICGGDGLTVVGHDRYGNRTPTNAENIWHGGPQFRSERISPVLECVAPCEPSLHCVRPKTGMGVRLAFPDFRRDDLRESWPGTIAHDGPRSERHEPGNRSNDLDYRHWIHRGWSGI